MRNSQCVMRNARESVRAHSDAIYETNSHIATKQSIKTLMFSAAATE